MQDIVEGKVVSPQAEVIFEDENGEVENIFEDEVPYDLKADVIEYFKDYGIWYGYDGKSGTLRWKS